MKVLITGGSGLVGRCMIKKLEENNIEYIATYNSRPIKNGFKINHLNSNEVEKLIIDHKITVCVNCIVQRQTDICEKDWNETKAVNIDLVDTLSRVCNKFNIHLIHISTDYVFDGKAPPYSDVSEVNPLQNYGISKLISEKRVIANTNKYTIIRVPVLYSDDIENLEVNAVTLIGKKVLNQIEETKEDDYSIRRPVYIPDFCNFIMKHVVEPEIGIFHYYNPHNKTTKYEMAKLIASYLNKSSDHIKPAPNDINIANRPYDTQLIDTKYDITKYENITIEKGIELCFSKWKHPDILTSKDVFLLIDLDGTILNSDILHFEAYKDILHNYDLHLTYDNYNDVINNSTIDKMLECSNLAKETIIRIKKEKYNKLITYGVEFIKGADIFLEMLIENDINFAIVTNTSKAVVEHFKEKQPLLNKVKNWICREDYSKQKPDPECYKLAIDKFYKGETYKIGFENTLTGLKSIKSVTDCIYFITDKSNDNYKYAKKVDMYLINDFTHFISK